jgi:thiol-disulfide isomerase/thioredoxin
LTLLLAAASTISTVAEAQAQVAAGERAQFRDIRREAMQAKGSSALENAVEGRLVRFLEEYPESLFRKAVLIDLLGIQSQPERDCRGVDSLAVQILDLGAIHHDYYLLGSLYHQKDCNPARSLDLIEDAILAAPDSQPLHRSRYHALRGELASGVNREATARDLDTALALLEIAIRRESEDGSLLRYAGVLDSRQKERSGLLWRAAENAENAGHPEDAAPYLQTLLGMNPDDEAARQSLIRTLFNSGLSREAAQVRADVLIRELSEATSQSVIGGGELPDARLVSMEGAQVRLSSYRGQPLLVAFWAGWCAPCFEEMPFLVELQNRYHAHGLRVLFVNLDKDFRVTLPELPAAPNEETASSAITPAGAGAVTRSTMIHDVLEAYQIPFEVLLGSQETIEQFDISALPLTLVVDKSGEMRYRHLGFNVQTSIRELLESEVREILDLPKD